MMKRTRSGKSFSKVRCNVLVHNAIKVLMPLQKVLHVEEEEQEKGDTSFESNCSEEVVSSKHDHILL
jgi:hypothetical protein